MSELLTLPGIIPTKLNHFLPLRVRVPGLKNPCPSHHLTPDPSTEYEQKGISYRNFSPLTRDPITYRRIIAGIPLSISELTERM